MPEKFYITTTLPYVNSNPHIGFALEIIQADAIARYQRMLGKEVLFNTGTDEHGLKIYKKAEERGITPKMLCDENAAQFEALKDLLNISYTNFIRTTDEDHKKAAQEFWRRCAANGDIYKKNYQVKYCFGCELEKTESELDEVGRCPIHPNLDLELIDEENYFFRFSKYQDALLKMYEERPNFVRPAHRQKEIENFTKAGLEDFSISRLKEKMPWGVPVPDDPDHVMYVWFDALVNYVSTLGWPNEKFTDWWPGVQIAGKDNLRQQSNMWQGMLMSAGVENSAEILIHGFMTSEGKKMSKSLGNVVDPFEVVGKYGIDPVRYYLLREIPTDDDGDFNVDRFEVIYRSELANNIGNLVFRVLSMTERYFDGKIPEVEKARDSQEATDRVAALWKVYQENIETFDLKAAIEAVGQYVDEANKFIEDQKPWALAKTDEAALAEVIYELLERLRHISYLLTPYIPEVAEKIQEQLGIGAGVEFSEITKWGGIEPGTEIQKGQPLFPKLEDLLGE